MEATIRNRDGTVSAVLTPAVLREAYWALSLRARKAKNDPQLDYDRLNDAAVRMGAAVLALDHDRREDDA